MNPDEPAVIALPPVLDLNAATPLARELLALRGRDLSVDGSAVERLGAQCLQVLLSARRTWESDGHAFTLTAPSTEMAAALALLGAPAETHFQPELAA